MIRYRTRKLTALIPTASMADIAFLLIIFFMYSTTFSVDRTSVELPESVVRQMIEKDAAIIAITDKGQLRVSDGIHDSQPVDNESLLEDKVREILSRFPARQFIIKCDKHAPYRIFNKVYEILIRNQAHNVALLTEKKTTREKQ